MGGRLKSGAARALDGRDGPDRPGLSNIREKARKVDTGGLNRGARINHDHQISVIRGIVRVKWDRRGQRKPASMLPIELYPWDPKSSFQMRAAVDLW